MYTGIHHVHLSQLGLPTKFSDMNISITDEKLHIVAKHCMGKGSSCWNVTPNLTEQMIVDAMRKADALGASL